MTTALAELRRESQSMFNRIHSIAEDAQFVSDVHAHYDFPLLPNMRCGAWYTDPDVASERAYFKSTDGHTNNWSFNLRRPNLHILPLIAEHAGLVLVDSTRAGKRIPDALSKTVPIWCAVVNRAILQGASENQGWDTALYTPPGSVSAQEHSQIEARLDGWTAELMASSYSLPALSRPLRPIWITPATAGFPTFPKSTTSFYPIICVSASKQVMDGTERRTSGFSYIQGSGDDHELWSMGLTPVLYWKHRDAILSTASSDLPDLIRSLVVASTSDGDTTEHSLVGTPIRRVSGRLLVCTTAALRRPDLHQAHSSAAFVCLSAQPIPAALTTFPGLTSTQKRGDSEAEADAPELAARMLYIHTPGGKKGQHRFLTVVLPRSIPFIQHHLRNLRTVSIACDTGTDISIGVVVAALALFFHPDGSLYPQGNRRDDLSKDVLKTRLQWIIASCPQANPSRTTLKRVNDFLLSPLSNPSSNPTQIQMYTELE